MAWVRTATALIGFGFTIVQFFERFGGVEGVAAVARTYAPRYVGLALIAAGILALAVSAWQYRKLIGYLRSDEFHAIAGLSEHEVQTPLLMISLVLILIGVFTFGAVFMRVL